MSCHSKVESDFRVRGASYIPEAGEIAVRVRRSNGLALCIVVMEHNGTEESLREANAVLRRRANRTFSSMSPTKSNTYYRAEAGDVGVVSADGKHIAPMDSEEGRHIRADAPGFLSPWED
jgi:hypothetical protein